MIDPFYFWRSTKNMTVQYLMPAMASLLLIFALPAHFAFAGQKPQLNPAWGKAVANCQLAKGIPATSHLWIFKQWHLPPSINTHNNTRNNEAAQDLPQKINQTAIYKQLDQWISASKIKTVFAEGCAGTIDLNYSTAFNGWTIQDLIPIIKTPDYDSIATHIPLKLEAKYGKDLATICADDDTLIKEQNLAFSDARGIVQFYSRLFQFRNDAKKAKPYLQGVKELYHLPQDTNIEQALVVLKKELKITIKKIDSGLQARNQKVIDVISNAGHQDAALVIGGLHAAGLMNELPKKGIGCTVVQPVGYEPDAEKSMDELRDL